LHPDPTALATLPFSFLVVNVALEFFHRNSAGVAGHVNTFTFVSMIALPIHTQNSRFLLASIRENSRRAHTTEPDFPSSVSKQSVNTTALLVQEDIFDAAPTQGGWFSLRRWHGAKVLRRQTPELRILCYGFQFNTTVKDCGAPFVSGNVTRKRPSGAG
jgi:hypothetical protein